MPWHRRPSTLTRADKDRVLRAHHHTCHVCGHAGATQVDHITNVAAGGTDHPSNLAPIHGTPYGTDPCPTCGATCHKDKTQAEAVAARVAMWAKTKRPATKHPGLR